MFMAEPPCPPELILRSAALRQGFSADEVQEKRRRGEWVALRPGAYVPADALKAMDPLDRHLALIAATGRRAPEDATLSHLSAACLWRIDLWEPTLRAVQLTRPSSGGGHRRRSLQTFRTALPAEDVVTQDGYRVTAAARTVVDLAKQLPFEAAVVAANSALHAGITTVEELTAAADRQNTLPGPWWSTSGDRLCRRAERERRGIPHPGDDPSGRASSAGAAVRGPLDGGRAVGQGRLRVGGVADAGRVRWA
jgi:hypothetical protein